MTIEQKLLALFVGLKISKIVAESSLSMINKSYYQNKNRQKDAKEVLEIEDNDFDKTLSYSEDKQRFSFFSYLFSESVALDQ